MVINVSVQYSPRHHTVDPMSFPWGNPFKCHEEVLYLQPFVDPTEMPVDPGSLVGTS